MRWLLSWSFYLLGDLVWRLDSNLMTTHPVYSRLMLWADTIQGPSNKGPWSRIEERYDPQDHDAQPEPVED